MPAAPLWGAEVDEVPVDPPVELAPVLKAPVLLLVRVAMDKVWLREAEYPVPEEMGAVPTGVAVMPAEVVRLRVEL